MPCPTCDHTVQGIGFGMFWCPRCGTLIWHTGAGKAVDVPKLVERCRKLEAAHVGASPGVGLNLTLDWHRLGLAESINKPEDRP